jgi:hypothetical protein
MYKQQVVQDRINVRMLGMARLNVPQAHNVMKKILDQHGQVELPDIGVLLLVLMVMILQNHLVIINLVLHVTMIVMLNVQLQVG